MSRVRSVGDWHKAKRKAPSFASTLQPADHVVQQGRTQEGIRHPPIPRRIRLLTAPSVGRALRPRARRRRRRPRPAAGGLGRPRRSLSGNIRLDGGSRSARIGIGPIVPPRAADTDFAQVPRRGNDELQLLVGAAARPLQRARGGLPQGEEALEGAQRAVPPPGDRGGRHPDDEIVARAAALHLHRFQA